jgi:hypothetical protein
MIAFQIRSWVYSWRLFFYGELDGTDRLNCDQYSAAFGPDQTAVNLILFIKKPHQIQLVRNSRQ